MSDGFNPQCIFCTKKSYVDNQDRLLNKQKLYDKQNREKVNTRWKEYIRKRRDSDLDFKLACNLRNWLYKAYKAQNVLKTSRTFDLLGCSHSFFQNGLFIIYMVI